jgi:hypothetical protein
VPPTRWQGVQVSTDTDGTTGEDRRLRTIRGLLAKAEATDYPEEAEAFFAKASELIARFAIDEAMLWADADRSVRERPDELRLVVHAPYLAQKSVLVGAVAAAHGCRTVRLVSGVGFPSELRWVETLVTSLLVQLTSAMLAAAPGGLSAAQSASWRRSFIVGFADEVATRLQADRRRAAASDSPPPGGSPTVAVVLASREDEVARDFRRRFPSVRSSWASRGTSRSGRDAGRRAGREASLDRNPLAARRAIGSG